MGCERAKSAHTWMLMGSGRWRKLRVYSAGKQQAHQPSLATTEPVTSRNYRCLAANGGYWARRHQLWIHGCPVLRLKRICYCWCWCYYTLSISHPSPPPSSSCSSSSLLLFYLIADDDARAGSVPFPFPLRFSLGRWLLCPLICKQQQNNGRPQHTEGNAGIARRPPSSSGNRLLALHCHCLGASANLLGCEGRRRRASQWLS